MEVEVLANQYQSAKPQTLGIPHDLAYAPIEVLAFINAPFS
jgi:hypothetical protein